MRNHYKGGDVNDIRIADTRPVGNSGMLDRMATDNVSNPMQSEGRMMQRNLNAERRVGGAPQQRMMYAMQP